MAKFIGSFAARVRASLAAAAAAFLLAACAGGATYVGVGVADPYFYGGYWYHDHWCCGGDVDIDIDIDGPGRPETLPAPINRPEARPQPLPSTRPSMPTARPMPAARGGRR